MALEERRAATLRWGTSILMARSIEDEVQVLHELALDERIELLRKLVEHWLGPVRTDASRAEAPHVRALPRALRWWSSAVFADRVFRQNHLRLDATPLADGLFPFLFENQYVWEMACPLGEEDPEILVREASKWEPHPLPVSVALLYAVAQELMLSAPVCAWTDRVDEAWLGSQLVRASVEGLRIGAFPHHLYVKGDVLAQTMPLNEGWVGAKREEQLEFLKGRDWDRVEL